MDKNLRAKLFGDVAIIAGNPKRQDVGDNIDRGLILEKLLNEAGFILLDKDQVCELQIKALETKPNGF